MRTAVLLIAALAVAGCAPKYAPAPAPKPLLDNGPDNGLSTRGSADVATAVKRELDRVGTVHVVGNLVSRGRPVTLDLRVSGDKGALGTVTAGDTTVQVLRIGDTAYLRADAKNAAHLVKGADAARVAGKWLKAPAADVAAFTGFSTVDALTAPFAAEKAKGTVSRVVLRSRPAIRVSWPDGTVLLAAATGKPYPLRLQRTAITANGERGTLTFSDPGTPVPLTAPPADQMIDRATLR